MALGVAAAVYLVPVVLGVMNPSTPVDYLLNLGTLPHDPSLAQPTDGKRRVVVLVHGLWRSAGSLWKLERALRDHGYETWNVSYPSTRWRIEQHAERLGAVIATRCAAQRPDELHLVGHSMGGLVIRAWLGLAGAPVPTSCVFLATPHHGATLLDRRRETLGFGLLFGDQAALQLSRTDPLYPTLPVPGVPFGNVIGGRGDAEGWNPDIPGDDDGTVGVSEAALAGATDTIQLRLGHTRISFADAAIVQVLAFLKGRRFRR